MSEIYGVGGEDNGSPVYGMGALESGSPIYGDGGLVSGSPIYGGLSGFLPSDLANLELWTKYNSGITVTGAGVSQWDDVSGNGNHLKQATDTNRPSEEADGSILFDGVDNFLKADAFTLVQPETVYILFKQITWTSGDRPWDGNVSASTTLFQTGTTPSLSLFAGATLAEVDLTLDTYGIVSSVVNGASSVLQLNNDSPITGNTGANDMGGYTLGARENAASFANIQVKEVLIYSAAHDATTRAQIIAYLQSI